MTTFLKIVLVINIALTILNFIILYSLKLDSRFLVDQFTGASVEVQYLEE